MSLSATAEQLREARQRIASLERELHDLRSTSNTPTHSQPSVQPKSPIQFPKSNRLIAKPRRPIMTRRAAAAAAAAAAFTSTPPHTENTSDLSKSASNHIPNSPSPAEYSDVSRDPSELSSSHPPVSNPLPPEHQSASSPEQNTHTSAPVAPTPQLAAANIDLSLPNNHASEQNSQLSLPIHNPPSLSRSATPVTVASGKSTPSPPGSPTTQSAPAHRRRPPPLPVAKTASTKKEKHHLVAKCTEPKPGQTRYWTDEEHERFLEAMAEYGEKAYVAISNYVETRTPKQVRTHAQKFQMKMARLARQSIEAGQPIQMPAGMRPVIELPIGPKSTIVSITPDKSIKLASKSVQGISEIDPSILCALSASQMQEPPSRRNGEALSKEDDQETEKPKDAVVKVSSDDSNASSSALADPYLNYIGAAGEAKEEMELENTFAAKLTQTLQGTQNGSSPKDDRDFLMSDGSSDDAASSGKDDDDLEDLENLEDGDLSLAPFGHPSDNWLLPDSNVTPCE